MAFWKKDVEAGIEEEEKRNVAGIGRKACDFGKEVL